MDRVFLYYSANTRNLISRLSKFLKLECEKISPISYYNFVRNIYFAKLDDKLGVFYSKEKAVVLNEELIYQSEDVLFNVALHEFTHAYCYYLNNDLTHSPYFREIAAKLNVKDDFQKAKVKIKEINKIVDKIKKLEVLSSSNYDKESEAALLKIQELIIKYEMDEKICLDKDCIYQANLYQYKRNCPLKYKYLAAIVSLVTGAFIIQEKTNLKSEIVAYAPYDILEVTCYVFDQLYFKIENEFKKIKHLYKGDRAALNSYYAGVYLSISKRFKPKNSKELVEINTNYKNAVNRFKYSDDSVVIRRKTFSRTNKSAYEKGENFGSSLKINPGVKKDSIKLLTNSQ